MYGFNSIFQIIGLMSIIIGIFLIISGIRENDIGAIRERYPVDYGSYDILEGDPGEYNKYNEFGYNSIPAEKQNTRKTEFGGVIMIGPIPIIFGNNTKAVNVAILLAIILITLFFLMFFVFPMLVKPS